MPSSYTLSLRLTLQATGENNNTRATNHNQGVFGLVDYAIAGRLAFTLSGAKTLTTALGATDEARAAMLDVTGGTGGVITLPAVSKGYFIRNNAAGPTTISQGGPITATLQPGDMGPVFTDGAGSVFQVLLGNLPIRDFVTQGDQAVIDYVNAAISAGNTLLPPAAGETGHALMVRQIGVPPADAWVPSLIQPSDVQGLVASFGALAVPNIWTAPQTFQGDGLTPALRVVSAAEAVFSTGAGVGGAMNFDAATAGIAFYPGAATAAFTLNFRGSAAQTFAGFLAVGDFETFSLIAQQGATTFSLTALSIDGVVQVPLWQTGVQPVPVSGTVSVYTVAIRNNGGGNYTVLASMTRWG